MFFINYQIIESDADSFWGQHGFFKIGINGHKYGDIFPMEVARKLIPDEIVDWFDRITDVLLKLKHHNYVALSDSESYNTWLEFIKLSDEDMQISLRLLEKWNGSGIFEYHLPSATAGDWVDQKVSIVEFEREVINKTNQYVQEVLSFSPDCLPIHSLMKKLQNYIREENTD